MASADIPYGERLATAMETRSESVLGLARKMADRLGTKPESERSTLRGYLHRGDLPREERAELLAELLEEPALADAPRSRNYREITELRREFSEARHQDLEEIRAELAELRQALLDQAELVRGLLASQAARK